MYWANIASIRRLSAESARRGRRFKAHWDSIAATDFFTVEVVALRGLVTYYVLLVLDLAGRTVKIAGITAHPHEAWMVQMAHNLTDAEEPFLGRTRFLIMDRDTKYSAAFRAALTREHIEPIRLPPRSPNLSRAEGIDVHFPAPHMARGLRVGSCEVG